jgi:hypothetical protein
MFPDKIYLDKSLFTEPPVSVQLKFHVEMTSEGTPQADTATSLPDITPSSIPQKKLKPKEANNDNDK